MTTTPPDWYPDPDEPSQLRYWDGNSWTEHVAPKQPEAPSHGMTAEPTGHAQMLESLGRKAQKALMSVLDPSEALLVVQPGENAALVATDRRILVCKWGITSGAIFGSQVNSWDFAHVTGIEYRKGMTTKSIVVQTAGAQVVTQFGRMDKGPTSVWEAPNALFVSGNTGEGAVATLRQMISDHHRLPSGSSGVTVSPAGGDPADQIRRFAALRDEGLISEDEFQTKKRMILGF